MLHQSFWDISWLLLLHGSGSGCHCHRSTYIFRYFMQVICGQRKFLAQLNEEWGINYMPKHEEKKICSQGDLPAFKWTKHHEELLFCVASGEMLKPELIPSAAVPDGAILIIINVRF